MNLMINSMEAMKAVERRRELTLSSERNCADQLLVSVSDTGVGLPPEGDQIFKAFFTTQSEGTGMGLAISRSIIKSHGGPPMGHSRRRRRAISFHATHFTDAIQFKRAIG
jgi:signal transduction histidine kinase